VSDAARACLENGDEIGFLTTRLNTMIDDERAIMAELGLAPPADRTALAGIEHEDDGSERGLLWET
jgi:hypothetical protein